MNRDRCVTDLGNDVLLFSTDVRAYHASTFPRKEEGCRVPYS
jgi:hypothetical protein